MPATRKVLVEVEVPEETNLEELLRGVKYRVLGGPVAGLNEILRSASKKRARIDRVPAREEINAGRA